MTSLPKKFYSDFFNVVCLELHCHLFLSRGAFPKKSSKESMYSAEQALEQIWNDSGNEGDLFDSNESEFEMYSASKDK